MRLRVQFLWQGLFGLALVSACASYEAKPLELEAHYQRFLARLSDWEPPSEAIAAGPRNFDLKDGVDAAEAEVLALFLRPDLRQLRAEAAQATALFAESGRWQDPEFGFSLAEVLSPANPIEWGATLQFVIPLSGRLEATKALFGERARLQEQEVIAAEWEARIAVRQAFAALAFAHDRKQLESSLQSVLDDAQERVQTLAERGEIPRHEGRLYAIEATTRRLAAAAAERERVQREAALRTAIGLPPTSPLAFDLSAPLPAQEPRDRDAWIAANPELAVARAAYAVAERELERQIRQQYPDLEFGNGYGEEGDTRALFGLAIPIPLWNANRQAIAGALAARETAARAAEATVERLSHALNAAELREEAERKAREEITENLLPLLEVQRAELERLASLGALEALELLDTFSRQRAARIAILEATARERQAAIQREALYGPDLKTSTADGIEDAAAQTSLITPALETTP